MGIACAAPALDEYRQQLIDFWDGKRSMNSLHAINEVMRATAIIPGGKCRALAMSTIKGVMVDFPLAFRMGYFGPEPEI